MLQILRENTYSLAMAQNIAQADMAVGEIVRMVVDYLPDEDESGEIDYDYDYDLIKTITVDWLKKHCPLGQSLTQENVAEKICQEVLGFVAESLVEERQPSLF
jgi:hypothetical protein